MDVKKSLIAELTSKLSEVNYDSDEDNLLLKDSGNDGLYWSTAEDNEFTVKSSKLRKANSSVNLPEKTYGGKSTTRKKTYSLTDSSDDEQEEDTNEADDKSQDDSNNSEAESDYGSGEGEASDEAYSSDDGVSEDNSSKSIESKKNAVKMDIYSSESKNIPNDVKKGTAIRNQIRIWESLLEGRIKIQKALAACNNLPAKEELLKNKMQLDVESQSKMNKIKKSLLGTLEKMVILQKELLKQNKEFGKNKDVKPSEMDVEIKSDESEIEDDIVEEEDVEEGFIEPPTKKRKLNDYGKLLKESHEKFIGTRNASIQKWNDKTKISTGKMANSNFSAFDQSTLKQIEQIMADKSRLINRTRVKRSEGVASNKSDQNDSQDADLDAEIFDDTDFYHKLLRDYIERKTVDVANSSNTERQMIELQKLRSKMKKKVDTKSTKGRKLRYVVISKLVNFMAPNPYNTWSEQAETDLFNSLFGKIKA